MGRTRTKKQTKERILTTTQSADPQGPSVSALLEKAQTLIVQCDYDLALQFSQRILEKDRTNIEAKEILGVALLETGDIAAAKDAFQSLIPPHPDAPAVPPPSAHLYLAQLSEDDPKLALKHYQAAVDILLGQLKGKVRAIDENSKRDEDEIRSNTIRALIGQVEIWMDPSYDLCFEPDAEKNCEDLLSLALKTYPGNPEALQALASVRLSQQRPEDAKQCLEQAWSAWKDLDLDDANLPAIPNRLALVKLFIELDLYTPALLVLQGIMSTDDQQVEAWYLEGWCFYLMAEQARENGGTLDELTWQELAKDSRDCLETCQVLHRNQEYPDRPLLGHAKELISKLDVLGVPGTPANETDENGDESDGWESFDGSTDEDGDVEMQ